MSKKKEPLKFNFPAQPEQFNFPEFKSQEVNKVRQDDKEKQDDKKIISHCSKVEGNKLKSSYHYKFSKVYKDDQGNYTIFPKNKTIIVETQLQTEKLGLLLVGLGGNNGSTLLATIESFKRNLFWNTKEGEQRPNFFGSLTQSGSIKIGVDEEGNEVYIGIKDFIPLIRPEDLIIDGWDISSLNLYEAVKRAKVLDYDLQRQLEFLKDIRPKSSIYKSEFIASNQEDRADNVLQGTNRELVEKIRADIRGFKATHQLKKVIILWTANTERFTDERIYHRDWFSLEEAIDKNEKEISPSTLFAVASVYEGCPFINGSPQNTFVPGVIDFAEKEKVFIAGDDFKSGQTKMKSVLVDFLIGAGIKPTCIASYNHLGNNDGKNLSEEKQFTSKEISKSNVIDDMVKSNPLLYKEGEKPDHCVVIKYLPYIGDSKRALDEYTSEIFMGGKNTITIHNVCEDSLLATPIILDLVILMELFTRIKLNVDGQESFEPVQNLLSYFLKAPLKNKHPHINSLFRQRYALENFLRMLYGLSPENHLFF